MLAGVESAVEVRSVAWVHQHVDSLWDEAGHGANRIENAMTLLQKLSNGRVLDMVKTRFMICVCLCHLSLDHLLGHLTLILRERVMSIHRSGDKVSSPFTLALEFISIVWPFHVDYLIFPGFELFLGQHYV